jgi:Uma2 family endonuclease
MTSLNYTSKDLELLPDNGKRYEIIDGELYMSKQPHWHHQFVGLRISMFLQMWNDQTKAGIANYTPGLIFDDDEDVVPDVVWISRQRLAAALQSDGKLHDAPELAVEILSPGSINERRDRELKLKLYSRRGVLEYWVVDWHKRRLEVYRRLEATLTLAETLYENDVLVSPLLPGFQCKISRLFEEIEPLAH